jgi:8-oxo-dGTP diphosphatase
MAEATVAAVITGANAAGETVLLTRRACDPFKGQWCLPGGHIDAHEPVRDAIIREVKEETGLDFEPAFFGCFDEIIPDHGIHAVVIAFSGQARGAAKGHSAEVSELGWFPIVEARRLPLAFRHREVLDAYLSHQGR